MTEFVAVVVALGAILLACLLVCAWYFWQMKRKVAETDVRLGQPFDMRFMTKDRSTHKVYLKFKIQYTGHEDNYGIMCSIKGMVGGELVLDDVVGIGQVSTPDVTSRVSAHYLTSLTTLGGGNTYSATVVLGRLVPVTKRSEMVVNGKITAAEGTEVRSLKAYVAH